MQHRMERYIGMSRFNLLKWIKSVIFHTPQDKEDLTSMLQQASKDELLEHNTVSMIEGVLEVQETRVRDVMVPRPQMVTIEHDSNLNDTVALVAKSGHSRYPITGISKDEIIGILLAKDLLDYAFTAEQGPEFNIREIMRPAVFIPESKRLNVLLQDFRVQRNHMAIVVDEYGRITGLITIEDVLEKIVGNIEDEHDIDPVQSITPQSDGSFTVKALTSIEEFNQYFNSAIEADHAETIGGVIIKALGHVPKRGESVDVEEFSFSILRADSRRVYLLSVLQNTTTEGT